jgi:DNA-directed RNA polymerase specialized sigma24 family protein
MMGMTDAPPLIEHSPRSSSELITDFESFYLVNRVRLFRAHLVVTRDVHLAEELTQEAFVAVWERWDRVQRMDDPSGYLYRSARQISRKAG